MRVPLPKLLLRTHVALELPAEALLHWIAALAPFTVNVPEFKVDDPAGDGAPMSCASQGAGTAANTLEAPQSAMSAMSHDTRMTSNRRQIGMWNTRWKDAARGAGIARTLFLDKKPPPINTRPGG